MLALIGIIIIFALGFFAVNLLIDEHLGEKVGLGFLIGGCLFTLLLFFLEKLGIGFTPINSWIILSVSTILIILVNIIFKKPLIPKVHFELKKNNLFQLGILVFISISSFVANLASPVNDWDALTLFDLRARIFLSSHSSSYLGTDPYFTMHNFYTSLMHYWFLLTGWYSPLPFYSIIFSSFLILSYFLFRRYLSQKQAILFTVALALAPHVYENTFIAYTNLSYSIFMVLGAIYLYFWSKMQKPSDLILGIFFSIMTIWVRKVEPLWLANLTVIPYFLIFKQNKKYLKLLIVAPVFVVAYYAMTHLQVILHFDPRLLLMVVDFVGWSVVAYYYPYFLIPIIIFVHQIMTKRLDMELLLLVFSHLILIILGAYGFASENPNHWSGIPDAIRRLTLYWPILVIFTLSLNSYSDNKHVDSHLINF